MCHPHQLSTINHQLCTTSPMSSDMLKTTTTDTEFQLEETTLAMMEPDTLTPEDKDMVL